MTPLSLYSLNNSYDILRGKDLCSSPRSAAVHEHNKTRTNLPLHCCMLLGTHKHPVEVLACLLRPGTDINITDESTFILITEVLRLSSKQQWQICPPFWFRH
jgi:hypothetical protein